jgi:hypothetical protein
MKIVSSILTHPRRDPGCFRESPALLSGYVQAASAALVLFDFEGCGSGERDASAVEADLRQRLSNAGWGDRAEVIVLDPELEAWVWSESPHVARILGWQQGAAPLRAHLESEGTWPQGLSKPPRPKEALEAVLRRTRVRRSPAIYGELARTVSLDRCSDPAFQRLRSFLRSRFAAATGSA